MNARMIAMKCNLLNVKALVVLMALAASVSAQNVEFDWVKGIAGSSFTPVRAMAQDDSGNVYITGNFQSTVDFDPGVGTFNMTAAGFDTYVLKLDSAGNFVWAKKFTGGSFELGKDIKVGPSGSIYVAGKFAGTADFDPGSGNTNTSSANWDGYLVKLNTQGDFQWVRTWTGGGFASVVGIDLDAEENVYLTGRFNGAIDLDPGTSTQNVSVSSAYHLFCAKLDSAGNYSWGRSANSANIYLQRTDDLYSDLDIAASSDGDVYITGLFQGAVDFDFGTGTSNLSSSGSFDVFLLKMDSAGSYEWAHKFGSSGQEWFGRVDVDNDQNVYLAASYQGTVDFDPGVSTHYVTVSGRNLVVAKFDSAATLQWTNFANSGAISHAHGMFVNDAQEVFVIGGTTGNVDFDPSTSVTDMINGSFVAKYGESGEYVWAKRLMAYQEAGTRPEGVAMDAEGHVYTAGFYEGSHDVDPDPSSTYTLPAITGYKDMFVHKMRAVCSNTEETQYITACGAYTWIDSVTYTQSTDTPTVTFTTPGGCDSVLHLSLLIHEYDEVSVSASDTVICQDASIDITIDTAFAGSQYYLREGSSVLAGPVSGTDSTLVFTVDSIQSSTSYNILVTSDSTESALNLPNNNDYIRFETPFVDYDKQLTVEAWVKFDGTENPKLGQSTPYVDQMTSNVWLWEGNAFYVNDNGTWRNVAFPIAIPQGWVHVATVADTSGLYIYYDGTLVASSTSGIATGILYNKQAVLDLGHDPRFTPGSSGRNTDVPIDHFMVWDTVRTSTQIQSDMQNCLSGSEAGLVHYAKLNEGIGTLIYAEKGCVGQGYNTAANLWITGAGVCYDNCAIQMADTVDVVVNMPTSGSQTEVVCDSFLWAANGQTYTTSGTYVDTLTNAAGCDSVVTLNLTVNYSNSSSQTEVACNSYTWSANNVTYTTSGTYIDTLTNAAGCDSVVTLNLTVNYSNTGSQTEVACDSYTWSANNVTYTTSGTYIDTLTNAAGCDSVVTLNLTVNYSNTGSQTEVVCDSFMWSANNVTYTSSGTYVDTLTNAAGCDSIVTLNLTVNYSNSSSQTEVACDSFTWSANNVTYTTSGTYIDTLTNAAGCDSVVTLNLTVNYSNSGSQTEVACDSYTWSANNVTYTTSGTYIDTLTNAAGCDSVVTLNLTVNYSSTGSQTEVVCDSFTWSANNVTYTASGTYIDTLTNAAGCDSVVTLNLTVNYSDTSSQTEVACNSYTWLVNNVTYTTSGTYVDTLTNAAGCDSVVTLNLTVNYSNSGSQTEVACDSFTWLANNVTYTTSGTYVDTLTNVSGCDSVVTLELTINETPDNGVIQEGVSHDGVTLKAVAAGAAYQWFTCVDGGLSAVAGATDSTFVATMNGAYAVEVGANGCVDTSECVDVNSVGVGTPIAGASVSLFPNPASGEFNLQFDTKQSLFGYVIKSMTGQVLVQQSVTDADHTNVRVDYPSGVYLVEVQDDQGRSKVFRLVIQQ